MHRPGQGRRASRLETEQARVIDRAEKTLCDAELGVARLLDAITQRTQIQLDE